MESLEEMKKRVYEAAKYVAQGNNESEKDALQKLGVSPQCGRFHSCPFVHLDEQGTSVIVDTANQFRLREPRGRQCSRKR